MESENTLLVLVTIILFGLAACDVEKDREKCGNQLIGLATCLPYVSGEAKAPPPDCCTGFKQVMRDSRECVCILIKDRNDPSLGLKINTTLALSLPAKCNVPVNQSISDCPAILHLPPNSPDAKVFDDFSNSSNKSNATSAPATGSSSGATSTAGQQNGGGAKRRRLETRVVSWLLVAMAAVHTFINL